MHDFTLKYYTLLLKEFINKSYQFQTFKDYLNNPWSRVIILRHDVDLLPQNSLKTAEIEHSLGIKGTYYFRAVPESWDEEIILRIHEMGHEVGYHYENMDTISAKSVVRNPKLSYDEIVEMAYEDFCENLEKLRKLVPVSTICMHGSPKSKYDNKAIWEKYKYKELGIIGEPYYDMDFANAFYLTDTGRRWDGYKVSVRDKIPVHQDRWNQQGLTFHSTKEIIQTAKEGKLPDQIMITVHPQRWTNDPKLWLKEFVLQKTKNVVKKFVVKRSEIRGQRSEVGDQMA